MSKTPIGGELFIDRFCAHQRAATAKPAPVRAAAPIKPAPPEPIEEIVAIPLSQAPDDPMSDTGRMRAEVAAFMNRDQVDGADNAEVQEFLKERSGFDPSEMG